MPAPIRDEGPGSVLGNYRLIETLGEGGFGTVFRAEQTEPVKRVVALKLIKLGMDTREVVSRFEAERQALARMDHPAIAKVFDAGATETGRPYFVMELVEGEPITRYCDRRRLGTQERLELFGDVCLAVQHAHQKGILHRDLKPSNVLVGEVDGMPLPKVIDFGIAKAIEGPLTDASLVTERFQVVGTPEYMPPEQAGGSDVDTRADVYALGVLLYELLTGSLPFRIGEDGIADVLEALRHIRDVTPPKPSDRVSALGEALAPIAEARRTPTTSLTRSLRGDLDWIVMKALEKDRERRYATALDLAEDVARYLNHEPIVASPPSVSYRLRKFVRRNRLLVGASGAVAAAVVAAAASLAWGFLRVRDERDAAETARGLEREARREAEDALGEAVRARSAEAAARAEAEDALAEAQAARAEEAAAREDEARARRRAEEALDEANEVTEFLADMLGEASPYLGASGEVTVRDVLDRSAPSITREFAERPRVQARLSRAVGRAYRGLGLYDRAEENLRNAVRVGEEHFEEADRSLVHARLQLARLRLEQKKHFEEAERLCLEVLDALSGPADERAPMRISALDCLGHVYALWGRYAEAGERLDLAQGISTEVYGPSSEQTLQILANQLLLAELGGDIEAQDRLSQEVLELTELHHGPRHPSTLNQKRNRALTLRRLGRLREARDLLTEGVEAMRDVLGDEHPVTAGAISDLSGIYRVGGAYERSEALGREALDIYYRTRPEADAETARSERYLALTLWYMGRIDEAAALASSAVERFDEVHGSDHRETLESRNVLAILWHSQGRIEEALSMWREVLEGQRRMESAPAVELSTLQNIAMAQSDLGRYGEAEEILAAVLEAAIEQVGAETRLANGTRNNLAILYLNVGRLSEAEALMAEVVEIRGRRIGVEHPETLGSRLNLALILQAQGRYDEALAITEELVPIQRRISGGRIGLPDLLSTMASNLLALGRYEEAEGHLREAIAIAREFGEESSAALANARNELGGLCGDLGRTEEAVSLLREARDGWAGVFGETHDLVLGAELALAEALGEVDEARALVERVVGELRERVASPSVTAPDQRGLAHALLQVGSGEAAAEARELARVANERTHGRVPSYLATLARAHAAVGESDAARAAAEEALRRLPADAVERAELEELAAGRASGR